MADVCAVATDEDATLVLHCPACDQGHGVPTKGPRAWTWNGSLEAPTLHPSLRVVWEGGEPRVARVCHFTLAAGVVTFCEDSTHALAGQSRPLLPVDAG